MPIIDAHIHLDMYGEKEKKIILADMKKHDIEAMISVSKDLLSSRENLALHQLEPKVKPAFGFHPEQELPGEKEINDLLNFIKIHSEDMIAVGEVGLPYYLRAEHKHIKQQPYIDLLRQFVILASSINKPIILHAVYDDAPIVCDLLEEFSVKRAHFHWFKGDDKTIRRMQDNGYYISVTPDVLYEEEIQTLAKKYPLSLMMAETDGPWPFDGEFQGEMTHPKMIHQSIKKIAAIKRLPVEVVYQSLLKNTKDFYKI